MDENEAYGPRMATRQRVRKSNVRIVVTYFVVFVYCTTAVILTFVLLVGYQEPQLALGVFSGLSTLSASIAGFWFGNRSTGYPETPPTPGASADVAQKDANLIGGSAFEEGVPFSAETDDPVVESYTKGANK